MRKNDAFKSVSHVLVGLIKKYNLDDQIYRIMIISEWENIVGKEISKVCKPKFIKDNILFLEAKNTVWRQELDMKCEELLNLIDNKLKNSLINKIKFL